MVTILLNIHKNILTRLRKYEWRVLKIILLYIHIY